MSDQIILSSTLIALLCLFIWGKVRYDALAVGALFVLVVLEIIPANVAPAPIDTKRAGKAQQISVLKLVNKLVNGSKRSFLDVVFMLKIYFCQ